MGAPGVSRQNIKSVGEVSIFSTKSTAPFLKMQQNYVSGSPEANRDYVEAKPRYVLLGEVPGALFGAGVAFVSQADLIYVGVTASGFTSMASRQHYSEEVFGVPFKLLPKAGWHHGRVFLYQLQPMVNVLQETVFLYFNDTVKIFDGLESGSHFGWPGGLLGDGTGLWISEPLASIRRGRVHRCSVETLQECSCYRLSETKGCVS